MFIARAMVFAGIIVCLAQLNHAFGQENWSIKSPIPSLNAVTWAGTQIVAVGYEGAIFTSPDGNDWTRKSSGTTKALRTVAWNGSKIVATGDTVVATSSDGTVWNVSTVVNVASITAIAWVGSQFIGSGSRGIFSSTDGISWAQRYSGSNSGGKTSIAYGNNMIVVCDAVNDIVTSPDGISWTKRDSTNSYSSVIWTGTKFIAVGLSSMGVTSVSTSSNGTSWGTPIVITPPSPNGFSNAFDPYAMIWTGDQIILSTRIFSGNGLFTDGIFTSPDGIRWTLRKAPLPSEAGYINAFASSPAGRIIATSYGTILSSTDGISWAARTSSISGHFTSVCRTSDTWMFASATDLFFSSDALSWLTVKNPFSQNFSNKIKLGWTGTQLVAVTGRSNSPGAIHTSPDGVNWKQCLTNISGVYSIASRPDQNVAVGSRGLIVTSTDGNSWIFRNSGTNCDLNAVTYTGTQFVAVGGYGVILSSPDGIVWSRKYVSQINDLFAVHWTGAQLVAVGNSGTVITSPDGTVWTIQNSGTDAQLCGIAGIATRMAAIGQKSGSTDTAGIIISSRDGISWTRQDIGKIGLLNDIAYADSQFIAVGYYGTVLTSTIVTGVTTPLSKSLAPVFTPQISRQGITLELEAGHYSLSILDIAGRALYASSGTVGTPTHKTFNLNVSPGCHIVKLQQNGTVRVKQLNTVQIR